MIFQGFKSFAKKQNLSTTTRLLGFANQTNPASVSVTKENLMNNVRFSSTYSTNVALKSWTQPIEKLQFVPDVTFKTRVRTENGDFDWKDVTTKDLFEKKRVVIFSLPGAFTPTCSSTHLPGYEEAYDEILKLNVDDVYCVSVNDAFVMRQWGLHQGLTEDKTPGSLGFEKVKLIPDGAAFFTRGMGMSNVWDSERGFGERSWRYSAVINDMRIENIFVEEHNGQTNIQNGAEDPFKCSDAATMIEYLKSYIFRKVYV